MDRSRRPAVMVCFAVLGAWVACLELQVLAIPGLQLGPIFGDYAHNVIEVLAGVLCLGGAWQARREQSAWLLVGIGVLAWALGNLYYTVVLYDLESPPIPSPADAGFLLFPVLTMVGVLALVRARTQDVPKTLWTDGSIAALAVTAVSAAVIFQTAFDNVSGKTMVVATTLAYPLTDLLLIGVIVGALARDGLAPGPHLGDARPPASPCSGSPTPSTSSSRCSGTLQSPAWYDIGWSLGLLLVAFASWQPAVVRRPTPPDGLRFISVPLGLRRGRPGDADLRLPGRHEPGRGGAGRAVARRGHGAADADLPRERRDAAHVARRGADRRADRARQPPRAARASSPRCCPRPTTRARSCSCCSTSTASSTTTTPSATPPATRCWCGSGGNLATYLSRARPRVPDGRRRVLRAVRAGRRGRRPDHRRRRVGADRARRGLQRDLLLRRDRAPARGAGRHRGAADRRPAHVRAEERRPHLGDAPEQGRARARPDRARARAVHAPRGRRRARRGDRPAASA